MKAKAVICTFVGHRWAEATDVHETFPVLRCRRCGREQEVAPGTSGPEGWAERRARAERERDLTSMGGPRFR